MIKPNSKNVGLSLADVAIEEGLEILAIDRTEEFLSRPNSEEKLRVSDRLLVYGNMKSIRSLSG